MSPSFICNGALTDIPIESFVPAVTDWTVVAAIVAVAVLIKGNNSSAHIKL